MKFDDLVNSILDEGVMDLIKQGKIQAPNNPHFQAAVAQGQAEAEQAQIESEKQVAAQQAVDDQENYRASKMAEIKTLLKLFASKLTNVEPEKKMALIDSEREKLLQQAGL